MKYFTLRALRMGAARSFGTLVTIYQLTRRRILTIILLTWTKWWAPASASKWRMGFNSAFKGLNTLEFLSIQLRELQNAN
jgi:hypothetical protein